MPIPDEWKYYHNHHIKLPSCLLCPKTTNLKQHHILFKSQGGGTWTVTLCEEHEQQAHTKGKKGELKRLILVELKKRGLLAIDFA